MGDELPGVLAKIFMLANGILDDLRNTMREAKGRSDRERMVEGAVLP